MLINPTNDFDRARADIYYKKLMSGTDLFEITKRVKRRTPSQNNLFHMWVQVVADHLGYTSLENCKRDIKRILLGTREEANRITGEIQQVDYQTSAMTTAELSSLMDKMKIWAQTDLGCYLPYFGDPGYEEMTGKYHG
ncbi:recombination protein NinB [Parabacteroides johnsonii]|uniref:recombination protein NinB n=1 Tax=Parabacteroides johnsonii TaxID=387661 RepID=UPI0011DE40ED|nr:recombination protein NinB [Parabacteroides johnsonii]